MNAETKSNPDRKVIARVYSADKSRSVKLARLVAGESVIVSDADLDALSAHLTDDDSDLAARYFSYLVVSNNPTRCGVQDAYCADLLPVRK